MSNKYKLYNVNETYNFDKETEIQMINRITDFVNNLKNKYNKDDNILIVTHHDWLYKFFKIYTGSSYSFKNCELKIVNID
jgi:hypothetical protein